MNYIVSLNSGAGEIESLIKGTKSMIIHSADVRCFPYGAVAEGDILFFVNNDNNYEVKARGVVSWVYNSYQLSVAESYEMIIRNQEKLMLPDDLFYKWAGKKYLVLIELGNVEEVQNGTVNRRFFFNGDGWCPVGNLEDSISIDRKTA